MTYKTKAIVLRSKAWPRNARLYVLYTQRFGKVKGVAAGVQKIKSKVAGHLQPFAIVEVMMAKGRNIDRLAQGRFIQGFPYFSQDFISFLRGSYILEIVDRLTREGVADQEIWAMIEDLFTEMNKTGLWGKGFDDYHQSEQLNLLIRLFALKLLDRFGFRPELYSCIHCQNSLDPANLYFSSIQSGTICGNCAIDQPSAKKIPVELIKIFRIGIKQSFAESSRIVLENDVQNLAISIIDEMVMMQTQKPLQTMQFLQSMKEAGSFV